ncbi:MAG: hypothetical protein AAGJ81_03565 [Verrucomicrobiota bacterium]
MRSLSLGMRNWHLPVFSLLTCWLASGLYAQNELPGEEKPLIADEAAPSESGQGRPQGPPPPFFAVDLRVTSFADADLDGDEGELGENRITADLSWNRFAAPNNITRTSLRYVYRNYDLTGDNPFAGAFNEVNGFRVGGTLERPVSGNWSLFGTGAIGFQGAEGANIFSGTTVPFAGGVSYLFGPHLIVGAGVLGVFESNVGTTVIPIVTIRWTPNDRFTLMTLNGVRVTYKLGQQKEWEVLGSILYETFVFAVDDFDGLAKDQAVVSQEYWQARTGLIRRFGRQFQIGAFLEGRFERKFDFYDNDREFDRFRIDNSLGFSIEGTYRF